LFFLFLACPPSNPSDDEPTHPRDYTWTVDTLAYPNEIQTSMGNIWGSSENDVYAVGHCTTIKGTMWHYNGSTWEPVVLTKSIGGNIAGHHNIENVFGFSENDVWAVGYFSDAFFDTSIMNFNWFDSGLVIHYDGVEWQEVTKLPTEQLTAIWGTSSNDLWVGGFHGGLFHYDGTTWTQDSIPIPEAYDTTYFSMFDVIVGSSFDNIYARYRREPGGAWFLHYDGTEWRVVTHDSADRLKRLWVSEFGTLFSVGTLGVSRWIDFQQEIIFENDDEFYFHEIFGVDSENIFIYSYKAWEHYGVIHHYNGEDLFEYLTIENAPPFSTGIWANDTEVFIMGLYRQPFPSKSVTLIYHGK